MRQKIFKLLEVVGSKLPPWLPVDKFAHLVLCSVATFSGSFIDIWFGIGLGVGLGLGKEFGDMMSQTNKWDWEDVFWNFGGVALGSITYLAINL